MVADKGYYNGKEVLLCDEIGVTPYIAKPLTSANTARGLYGKESFKYDRHKNCYLCPAEEELTYRFSTNELGRAISYYETSACARCALKANAPATKATVALAAWREKKCRKPWPNEWRRTRN